MKTDIQISVPSPGLIRHISFTVLFLAFLCPNTLLCQDPVVEVDSVTEKFKRYSSFLPREEIYVHTDREEYIAGEDIWFKLYLFDVQTGRLSPAGSIAYFEILNSDFYPVVQKRIRLDGGLGPGMAFLPDTLSSGRYTLRAYTNSMKNFVSDNCFSKAINVYNALNAGTFNNAARPYPESQGTGAIEFSDPGPAGIREKVVLDFQFSKRASTSGQGGNLSISVAPAGSNPAPDIDEFLLSGFGKDRNDRNTASSGDFPDLIYEAEEDRHFIRGQLLDRSGQGLAAGRYMFLSVPGKNAVFQYSLTDDDGRFEFSVPIEEGISDLIIQPENPRPDDVIRMESPFSGKLPVTVSLPASTVETPASRIMKWGVNYQLRRIFGTDSLLPPRMPVVQAREEKRFYGKPETELLLKDYVELPLMEEVFYELLEGVQLRSRRTGYEITMTDAVYNRPYEKPPVMFVDGVVIDDPSVIARLEPDKVEKIDVIRSRYVVGDYLFFGLVNVITKTGDFSSVALPDYAVRLPYRIFDPVPEFWSPSYPDQESRQSRIPDLRNTLYWNPSVKPGSDGRFRVEFWTSDYVTDYEINIQGVNSRGEPVSFRTILRAKE